MITIDRLVRSNRKTIALIVHVDGSLEVRAPLRATQKQIQAVVDEKSAWIQARQTEARANPPPREHKYSAGEQFYYLGHRYSLELGAVERPLLALVDPGVFRLAKKAHPSAKVVFEHWYRAQAQKYLATRTAELAARHGLHYGRVRITAARTRWGSCSTTGTISFSWRLMMAPPEVIDAVILHELVHTLERNHGRGFWTRLLALVPDYKAHAAWLKEHAQAMLL